MAQLKCCCFFPLKTSVWLIGLVQIVGLSFGIYNLDTYGVKSFFAFNLLLVLIFCCLFLAMMCSRKHDTQNLREIVFVYYVVVLTVMPIQYTLMGIYGIGFDITSHHCDNMQEQAALNQNNIDSDKCLRYIRSFYLICLCLSTAAHLYFSYFLKLYADVKSLSVICLDSNLV